MPSNLFHINNAKGKPFEERIDKHLRNSSSGYIVNSPEDILGKGVYRYNGRKYPDFTLSAVDDINELYMIDAKSKKGQKYQNTITISMDETYVYHYRGVMKDFDAKMFLLYFECTTNGKIYRIDINNLPKHKLRKGSPQFGDDRVYFFDVRDLDDISDKIT